jgi:hypothetical protein
LMEQAAFELESALATMKRFFEDGDSNHLQEGVTVAREASHKLYLVQERCGFTNVGT